MKYNISKCPLEITAMHYFIRFNRSGIDNNVFLLLINEIIESYSLFIDDKKS